MPDSELDFFDLSNKRKATTYDSSDEEPPAAPNTRHLLPRHPVPKLVSVEDSEDSEVVALEEEQLDSDIISLSDTDEGLEASEDAVICLSDEALSDTKDSEDSEVVAVEDETPSDTTKEQDLDHDLKLLLQSKPQIPKTQKILISLHHNSHTTLYQLFAHTPLSNLLAGLPTPLLLVYNHTKLYPSATAGVFGGDGPFDVYAYTDEEWEALKAKRREEFETGLDVDVQVDVEEDGMGVKIRDRDGVRRVKVKPQTKIKDLIHHYITRKPSLSSTSFIRFSFDGDVLDPESSIEEAEIEDGDMLDVGTSIRSLEECNQQRIKYVSSEQDENDSKQENDESPFTTTLKFSRDPASRPPIQTKLLLTTPLSTLFRLFHHQKTTVGSAYIIKSYTKHVNKIEDLCIRNKGDRISFLESDGMCVEDIGDCKGGIVFDLF